MVIYQGPLPEGTTSTEEKFFRRTGITISGRKKTGGFGAMPTPTTYYSKILNKVFSSSAARAEAEAIYRDVLARQRIAESKRAEARRIERARGIKVKTITGQIEGRLDEKIPIDFKSPETLPGVPIGAGALSREEFERVGGKEFPRGTIISGFTPGLGERVELPIKEEPQQVISSLVPGSGFRGTIQKEVSISPDVFYDPTKRTVEQVEPSDFFQKQRFKVQTGRDIGVGTAILGSVGAGVYSSVKETARFGTEFVQDPIETTAKTIYGIKQVPKEVKKVGPLLKSEPGYVLGFVGGEVAIFKTISAIPKGIVKGSDILRVSRAEEIPSIKIIAPEYPKQTYPRIRKGQTAGELLGEFKPLLPGETRPAGFTATPKPFPKTTEAGAGSSEIPGLYQAPKLSPQFLRVAGETDKKLFSLDIFETWKPSIIRITPKKFELIPGIKPGQRAIAPLKPAQKFFKEYAEPGKSYVPFVKTEKEAIITAGTPLQQVGKRYFIKFEGRRIPILEFEVPKGKVPTKKPITAAGEVAISYSRRITKPKSYFSPVDILSSSRLIPRSYRSGFISSRRSYAPRKRPGKISYDPYGYKSYYGGISYKGYGYGYPSRGKPYRPYIPPPTSYYPRPYLYPPKPIPIIPPPFQRSGLFKRKIRTPQYSLPPTRYTPSFTALAIGMKGRRGLVPGGLSIRPILRKRLKIRAS